MSTLAVEISEIDQPVTITLAGQPMAKQRARAKLRRGKIFHHTPEGSRQYEEQIRLTAFRAMQALGLKPIGGAVEVELRFTFAPAASWSEKRKLAAIAGEIPHVSKPDCDNLAKSWLDAMNRIVFTDDANVVQITARKNYEPASHAVALVRVAP
jgi:Holliday junction resolvase RusA-like endonuclease